MNPYKSKLQFENFVFSLQKEAYGISLVQSDDINSAMFALGYLHAKDRGAQLLNNRIVAKGQVCELLVDRDEAFKIDKLMRTLDLYNHAEKEIPFIPKEDIEFLESYNSGINYYFENHKRPLTHRLLKIPFEKWKIEDTLSIMRLSGFMGLAQLQLEVEAWMIGLIQKDGDYKKVESLFSPYIDKHSKERLELIKSAHWDQDYFSNFLIADLQIPSFSASNNWACLSKKSKGNSKDELKPLHCFDPHLDCLRLPTMWYESKIQIKERTFYGITVPGVPGIVMGTNEYFTMSFTYGCMDQVDFFIEKIENQKVFSENQYFALETKRETIKRKKFEDVELKLFQTSNGSLATTISSDKNLEDGHYFSWKWTLDSGVYQVVRGLREFYTNTSADEQREAILATALSCNWIISDHKDQIIYQQTGRAPLRNSDGLLPVEGWLKENMWKGSVPPEELYYKKITAADPEGSLGSANQYCNPEKHTVVNVCKGAYRMDRISDLLESQETLSLNDMKNLQCDLYSLRSKKILDLILPFIPNSKYQVLLRGWDCRFSKHSKAATLFEEVNNRLYYKLFGDQFIGNRNFQHFLEEAPLFSNLHDKLDRVFLEPNQEEEKLWFGQAGREKWLKDELKNIVKELQETAFKVKSWKSKRNHLVLNTQLPYFLRKLLKLDVGPIFFAGTADSVNQSTTFYRESFKINSGASFRFVRDQSKPFAYTALPGGNSEKFGPHYSDQFSMWEKLKYKKVKL
ncbi:MAG: penicillin acylase family protein [Bacteriovoracaceae bacterium]